MQYTKPTTDRVSLAGIMRPRTLIEICPCGSDDQGRCYKCLP